MKYNNVFQLFQNYLVIGDKTVYKSKIISNFYSRMGRRGRVRKYGQDNGFEEHGGYMAAKKAKLQEQFEKESKTDGEREGIFR